MRRLASVLIAAGLLVWLAAPALSARPFVPRAVEFEQTLSTGGWAPAGDRAWRSPVIRAPKRFDLVGLRWRSPGASAGAPAPRIRVRADGRWSPWTTMAGDHAGAPGSPGAEPVWAGGADAYQLRMQTRPRGLTARFVNATGSATRADRVQTALRRAAHDTLVALRGAVTGEPARAEAPGSRAAPSIIPREAWGADQCPPRADPAYGEVQLGFVHHTVNANAYSPQDSAAIVLSICRYHRNSNRWRDIGYNFLVDRYGQIFEGRAGGADLPVIGAQAQGYNGVSTAVANIGTFSQASQTDAGLGATAELLAWKLSLHGAPVDGETTVTSAGGPENRYRAGSAVTLPRIAEHRDADRTSCPGTALHAQLPQIRALAAELAPQFAFAVPAGTVSLQALDRTLEFPQAAELQGRATIVGGAALAGAPIAVQTAGSNGFVTVARATTDADGAWTAQVPTRYSRALRAVAQFPGASPVSSPPLHVQVAPRLRLRAPKRVTAGQRFTVRGSISPGRAQVVLDIFRQGPRGQSPAAAPRVVKVRGGRFTTHVRLRRPALYQMIVAFPGDARNRAAQSDDVYLRAVR